MFVKYQQEKRGKWYNPKTVLSYDKNSGTVTVPVQNGRKISAVEAVRFAITDNELALKYQEANSVMDMALNESIDSLGEVTGNESEDSYTEPARDLRLAIR